MRGRAPRRCGHVQPRLHSTCQLIIPRRSQVLSQRSRCHKTGMRLLEFGQLLVHPCIELCHLRFGKQRHQCTPVLVVRTRRHRSSVVRGSFHSKSLRGWSRMRTRRPTMPRGRVGYRFNRFDSKRGSKVRGPFLNSPKDQPDCTDPEQLCGRQAAIHTATSRLPPVVGNISQALQLPGQTFNKSPYHELKLLHSKDLRQHKTFFEASISRATEAISGAKLLHRCGRFERGVATMHHTSRFRPHQSTWRHTRSSQRALIPANQHASPIPHGEKPPRSIERQK